MHGKPLARSLCLAQIVPKTCIKSESFLEVRLRRTSSNGSLGSRRSSQSSVDRDYLSDNAAPPRRAKTR